jgi:SAM-dependent methyltransferase
VLLLDGARSGDDARMSADAVYQVFYQIPRLAASELSDGGGPFGFDIQAALSIDWLIERYACDAVIETGCNRGDTTHYLAQRYQQLAVLSCDIKPEYASFTRNRVAGFPNAVVDCCDSPLLLERVRGHFKRPLYFLDAHWYDDWPLERELAAIDAGVIVIDDFDIGDKRYGFDEYNGMRCGPMLMQRHASRFPVYYTNNPDGMFPYPCLQTGRMAGRAYLLAGLEPDYLRFSRWFQRRNNSISPATGA